MAMRVSVAGLLAATGEMFACIGRKQKQNRLNFVQGLEDVHSLKSI